MAIEFFDRIWETTGTGGATDPFALGGRVNASWNSFVTAGANGKTARYAVWDTSAFEIRRGVVAQGTPDTVSRLAFDAALGDRSSTGAAIDWPLTGVRNIASVASAQDFAGFLQAFRSVRSVDAGDSPVTLADPGDRGAIIEIDAAAGAVALALPPVAGLPLAWAVTFRPTDVANAITLQPDGTDTIDGLASLALDVAFRTVTLVPDGASNWIIAAVGEQALPLPLAVNKGGTGATTASGARSNLGVPGLGTANTFTGNQAFQGVNSHTKIQKLAKGADVASAATLTLGDDGNYFDVTGTTAITAIASAGVGTAVRLHFDGALTLTHHATALILPGGANITTAPGDEAEFVEYAAGDWRCVDYQRATGRPLVPAHDYILIRDQKTGSTDGGSAASGAWRTRDLNTLVQDTGNHASLSSNQVTLAAGTYEIVARAPFNFVGGVRIRWQNVTDGTTAGHSESASFGQTNTHVQSTAMELRGRFTISAQKTFELQYFCEVDKTTDGLGADDDIAVGDEIYSVVELRKVA